MTLTTKHVNILSHIEIDDVKDPATLCDVLDSFGDEAFRCVADLHERGILAVSTDEGVCHLTLTMPTDAKVLRELADAMEPSADELQRVKDEKRSRVWEDKGDTFNAGQ